MTVYERGVSRSFAWRPLIQTLVLQMCPTEMVIASF
jgi:hypothetical protein